MLPQLLVSVCDAQEAVAAIRGGAQIIDIKNPFQGPLGRADVDTVRSILSVLSDLPHHQTVSAALGETLEWMGELSPEQRAWRAFLHSCRDLQFLKLGTAGLLSDSAPGDHAVAGVSYAEPAADLKVTNSGPAADWEVSLENVRRQLMGSLKEYSRSREADSSDRNLIPEWISVAYADFQRCHAPSIDDVVAAAVRRGCRGLLVDTFVKDGSRLLDWCSVSTLCELRQITRASDLMFAVAGQLRIDDLERLVPIAPDVIAVRGAVCQQGLRTSGVQEALVREFARALSICFGTAEVSTESGSRKTE